MSSAPNLCTRCKNFLVPCPDCLSPAPAPESQGESVAAPAEVGQVMDTSWIRRSVALRKAHSDQIKAIAQADDCTYEFAMRRLILEGLAQRAKQEQGV